MPDTHREQTLAVLAALHDVLGGLFRHRAISRNVFVWTHLADTTELRFPPLEGDELRHFHIFRTLKPTDWIGGTSPEPLPGESFPVQWIVYAPDLLTGFKAGEWLYGYEGLPGARMEENYIPALLARVVRNFFSRIARAWEETRKETAQPTGISMGDRLVALTAGVVESALIEFFAGPLFELGSMSRFLHVLERFRRAAQITMEKKHINGGLIYTGERNIIDSVSSESRVCSFGDSYSWDSLHIRTFLKLLSLTDAEERFLLASQHGIHGIVRQPARQTVGFSDAREFIDAVVAGGRPGREWRAPWIGVKPTLRITGPGRGSIDVGSRRIVDLREGQFCFESAVAPMVTARQAAVEAGCRSKSTIEAIIKVVSELRARGKGAMFILCRAREELQPILQRTCIDFVGSNESRRLGTCPIGMVADWAALDGAVIINPVGVIETVGAILAPQPCGEERFQFGARHNSAIRISSFLGAQKHVIITVSEDGFVSAFQNGEHVVPEPVVGATTLGKIR